MAAIKFLKGKPIRPVLDRHREIFAVDSEVNSRITYVERDGDFAICYGGQTLLMRESVWKELRDILNDISGVRK